ncbi:Uncharacterised protein [Mycobacteroides abscessus subsp. abscessus]|nr:Uncharacterised protein [Mycobacteroides abscessus subsp. abscessus]
MIELQAHQVRQVAVLVEGHCPDVLGRQYMSDITRYYTSSSNCPHYCDHDVLRTYPVTRKLLCFCRSHKSRVVRNETINVDVVNTK